MAIIFISTEDKDKQRVIHSKSDNTEVMAYDSLKEIIEEFVKSLLSRYQIGLETQMRGSNFIFDCNNLMY